jgi:hypothetical protein
VRMEDFVRNGLPPADQPIEPLCEDHVGTYSIPFPMSMAGRCVA